MSGDRETENDEDCAGDLQFEMNRSNGEKAVETIRVEDKGTEHIHRAEKKCPEIVCQVPQIIMKVGELVSKKNWETGVVCFSEPEFNIEHFDRYLKGLFTCKERAQTDAGECFNKAGFRKVYLI